MDVCCPSDRQQRELADESEVKPCLLSSQPKGLLCQAFRPVQRDSVVRRAPAADVDVDEVDVEGQSCGLHGISDIAAQQADTWTD